MHNAFPFRYDYNETVRRLVSDAIQENYAALIRIQLRYRGTMPTENCNVRSANTFCSFFECLMRSGDYKRHSNVVQE